MNVSQIPDLFSDMIWTYFWFWLVKGAVEVFAVTAFVALFVLAALYMPKLIHIIYKRNN